MGEYLLPRDLVEGYRQLFSEMTPEERKVAWGLIYARFPAILAQAHRDAIGYGDEDDRKETDSAASQAGSAG